MFTETATILPSLLYHILDWPMNTGPNGGYNFWSGIGSGSPMLLPLGAYMRRHNCHVQGCPFMQWHATAAGDIVCRRHHPDGPKSHTQILAAHDHAVRLRRHAQAAVGDSAIRVESAD